MKLNFFLCFLFIFLLMSCAKQNYTLKNNFDAVQAMKALEKGNNTIKGEAFWKFNNDYFETCEGNKVSLIPETKYSSERMSIIYGNTERGYNPVSRTVKFNPDSQLYHQNIRTTNCSSSGNFEFNNIKDGTYFIVATTVYGYNGGSLMKKIDVKNGEQQKVVLSNLTERETINFEQRKLEIEREQLEKKKNKEEKRKKLIKKYGKYTADAIMKQQIFRGMSESALIESWGRPKKINSSVGSWGTHEQYVYDGDYVYVENGVVESWQTSR